MNQIFDIDINIMDNVNLDIINNIEQKCRDGKSLSDDEILYYLSYISYKVRNLFALRKGKAINNYNFAGDCTNAQSMLKYYFDSLNIKNIPVQTNRIFFNVLQHSFIIAYFMNDGELKPYLIDPTYNQFFDANKCLKSNFVYIDGRVAKTPDPGYFVLEHSEDDQNRMKRLLKYGFMELNRENSIVYGDSFYYTQIGLLKREYDVISSLNGLYLKFFLNSNFDVSKSEDDLKKMDLLLEPINGDKKVKGKMV